ncbi:MAG: phosphomannomutase/phosphoglucomutase [Ignavibacteriales bacterium]
MIIKPEIFRQYDIRGIADDEITIETAEAIGKAFGTITMKAGETKSVVGCDNRVSSEPLKQALIKGITSTGINVVDVGTVITPMLYYARILFGTNAGIMVTASHNPPQYNGFKICIADGGTMYGDQIQDLRRIIEKEGYILGNGNSKSVDIYPDYKSMIKEKITLGSQKLKVVVDCGNGTASLLAENLFKDLGCEVIPLFCESNPLFPNHFPDPVKKENLEHLIRTVLDNKADVGIAFDGDGDRLGVVDDQGSIIWGDNLMILFWREIMPSHPNSKVIIEVKCSQSLVDEVNRLQGEPFFFKTGHSLIKAKMKETGVVFTGEMSGHMFFADEYYGYDDAVYAGARLLRILSKTEKPLSLLLADINRYHSTPEIRIHSSEENKFNEVEKVRTYFKQKEIPMVEVDGVRAIFEHGWGLVRASNTGPELIVRCESKTPEGLEEIKSEIKTALNIQEQFSEPLQL